jgi:drug/metabolite transporter (DMT)-like permease
VKSKHSKLAHILLIAVTFVWGSTFSIVKAALMDVSPLLFNLLRMAFAFLILAAINPGAFRGITRRDSTFGALAGFFLALGYQFQTAGLAHTTAAKSAFITGLIVVIVPLLSAIPGIGSPNAINPTLATYAGAVLAFFGLILLTTPPHSGAALFSGLHFGEYLTLACAVAFAGHLLTLSKAAPHVNARRLGTLQIGFCTLTMLFTLPLEPHPVFHLTGRVLFALAITATFATAAAFTIQSYAQQHLPASHTALILTLEPVFAWLTALLFLHEHLGSRALSGAGLILAGILSAELLPARRGKASILNQASEVAGTGIPATDSDP